MYHIEGILRTTERAEILEDAEKIQAQKIVEKQIIELTLKKQKRGRH